MWSPIFPHPPMNSTCRQCPRKPHLPFSECKKMKPLFCWKKPLIDMHIYCKNRKKYERTDFFWHVRPNIIRVKPESLADRRPVPINQRWWFRWRATDSALDRQQNQMTSVHMCGGHELYSQAWPQTGFIMNPQDGGRHYGGYETSSFHPEFNIKNIQEWQF